MIRTFVTLFLALGLSVLFSDCRKVKPITDPSAQLEFSEDTLTFDTVFSSIGSSTRLFKVFNTHSRPITISSIKLAGGPSSNFRMNVDGIAGTEFSDIEIAANDSLYIFAEVTVDPGNVDNPFLITDSVLFVTNGNSQRVILAAYGQDAHFYEFDEICNETWTNDKPYVILGSILVDTNCTLTIQEGVRIFMHADANIFVAGTIRIEGTADSVVTFEGDRLEPFFDDLPGQWGNIVILRGSTNNLIRHAWISEATSAVVIGSSTSSDLADFNASNLPDITLEQVEIRNCRENGVFSFYSDVTAENTLVYNCGQNNLALLFGGTHTFTHCTFANYGAAGLDHKLPIFKMTNYAVQNQTTVFVRPADIQVRNSIIFGNIPTDNDPMAGELEVDTVVAPTQFDYLFENCLLKTNFDLSQPEFMSCISNAEPLFLDVSEDDYALESNSPAAAAGNPTYLLPLDLFGQPRSGVADLGAIRIEP